MPCVSSLPFSLSSLLDKSMIRRVYKSVAVIGRAHESVSVIRRALNSEAKPLVKYDVGSRSSGEGQNQTVAAIDDDSEAEEQAKVSDCYRTLLDIVQRRYSSASTYDVPKDSKAEEQPKVQDCRQVVIDEIQKGSCSPLTHYECRPADNFAHWLAIVEEFNERKAAGSGTKLTPEEEEAKLRYGPCECCGKEKDHATKNCPLKTIRF
ncbi:uncharacterized protein LOC126595586 isoform X1 [Malus sylvestris]|uniref:uncharacterized protein LOC126595586 isoform X1 n=1 Tax=Malus sylvestris TaxID=3752 RepID=UPI0021AC8AB5|nr:uncharacterized protein LOC126595586 isoform X1 [Malus sylvestris]